MTQSWKRKANRDLWARLDELCRIHSVSWEWVRGHAGDPYNERVDRLARAAVPRPWTRLRLSRVSRWNRGALSCALPRPGPQRRVDPPRRRR